jgi:hypothetical protein
MTTRILVALLAAAAAAAGCATTDGKSIQPRPEKIYRTGSNLPQRDPGATPDERPVDPAPPPGQTPPAGVPRSGG